MSLQSEHLARHPADIARNQIEAVSIPLLSSFGITLDCGTIPPFNRFPCKLVALGIQLDCGILLTTQSFKSKILSIGISTDKAEDSVFFYQVN